MPDEDGNIDPPWRLDPTINIINVSWNSPSDFLVGGYDDHDGDFVRATEPVLFGSNDGKEWQSFPVNGLEEVVRSLAYGGGAWYAGDGQGIAQSKDLTKGWKSVYASDIPISSLACGKPKNAKSLIIIGVGAGRAQSDNIIVVSNDNGETWSPQLFTGDGDLFMLTSVQFLNGAFYVTDAATGFANSGATIGAAPSRIWRSKDGRTWEKNSGLSITVPVEDTSVPGYYNSAMCGVTYDKKLKQYVAIGIIPYNIHVLDEAVSLQKVFQIPCFATSTDGRTWTQGASFSDSNWTDTGVFSNTGALFYIDDRFCHSIAASGKGLVVATHSNAHPEIHKTKTVGSWKNYNFHSLEETFPSDPFLDKQREYGAVAYSSSLDLFCSCGYINGTSSAAGITTEGKVLTSKDGEAWTVMKIVNAVLITVGTGKVPKKKAT